MIDHTRIAMDMPSPVIVIRPFRPGDVLKGTTVGHMPDGSPVVIYQDVDSHYYVAVGAWDPYPETVSVPPLAATVIEDVPLKLAKKLFIHMLYAGGMA